MKHLVIGFLSVLLLMSAKGCKSYPLEGKTVGILYPNHGVANVRQVTRSCPLQTTKATSVPISELAGWCAVPPEECAKYKRDYEEKVCGQ